MNKRFQYLLYSGGALALILTFMLANSGDTPPQEVQTQQEPTITNLPKSMIQTVHASVFAKKNTEEARMLLDVRTPTEYASGHLEKARNIDIYDTSFIEKIKSMDRNAPISIYCRSGNRSGQALDTMAALGFTDVIELEGGIQSWVREGNTVCTEC